MPSPQTFLSNRFVKTLRNLHSNTETKSSFRSIIGPPAGVPRINYWSNPSVTYNGLATGGTGQDGSHVYGGNEAGVLNWTRAIVAKLR